MAKLAAKQARRMQSQMMGVLPPFPGLMPGMPMSLNMMANMPPGFLAPHMAHMEAMKKKVREQEEATEASPTPAAVVPDVNEVKELIKGVYERRNPSKLGELDALFSKYKGSELDVYRHVCQKYGETPVTFSRPQEAIPHAEVPVPVEATASEAKSLVPPPPPPVVPKATAEAHAKLATAAASSISDEIPRRRRAKIVEVEEEYLGGWPFRGEPYTDNEDSDGPVPPEWLMEVKRTRSTKRAAPRLRIPAAKVAAEFDSDSGSSSSSSSSPPPDAANTANGASGKPGANADKDKKKAKSSSEDSSSSEVPMKPPSELLKESCEPPKVSKGFQVGTAVLYWSNTHRQWTPAVVTRQNLGANASIVSYDLDVKRGAQANLITLPTRPPPPPPASAAASLQPSDKRSEKVADAREASQIPVPTPVLSPPANNASLPQPEKHLEEANGEAVKLVEAEVSEPVEAELPVGAELEEAPVAEDLQHMYSQLFQTSDAAEEDEDKDEAEEAEKAPALAAETVTATSEATAEAPLEVAHDNSSTDNQPPVREEVVAGDCSTNVDEPRPLEEEVELLEGEIDELLPGASVAAQDDGSATEDSNA